MNLNELSVAKLTEVIEEAKAIRKEKRESEKESNKASKAQRDSDNRGKFADNTRIVFMFNKVETECMLVRQSEKSVTVEFELNGETVKRYRKYSDIVRAVEVAEVEESE